MKHGAVPTCEAGQESVMCPTEPHVEDGREAVNFHKLEAAFRRGDRVLEFNSGSQRRAWPGASLPLSSPACRSVPWRSPVRDDRWLGFRSFFWIRGRNGGTFLSSKDFLGNQPFSHGCLKCSGLSSLTPGLSLSWPPGREPKPVGSSPLESESPHAASVPLPRLP